MLSRRTVLATGAGLVLGGRALAQAPSAEELAASRTFFTDGLFLSYAAYLKTKGDAGADMLSTLQSMMGDEAAAFRTRSVLSLRLRPADEQRWADAVSQASTHDALDAIVRAAAGRRLVILNEAHHVSRSRAFAIEVARALRGQGFTYFAAETLRVVPTGPSTDLSVINWPTGFYSRDPVFADLLRDVRDGWQGAFAYEASAPATVTDPAQRTAFREEHQAETLATLLKRDPQMRLFVFCGYGHAEKFQAGQYTMMAAWLWEKTGIEPLTITQCNGAPAPDPQHSWPGLETVLAKFQPKTSIALSGRDGIALSPPLSGGRYDLSVFHPRVPDRDGRPGWLAALPDRRRRRVNVPNGPGLRLVQAIPSAERAVAASAVPADQVLVEDDRRSVDLWLAPGAYDLCCETLSGKTQMSTFTV